MDAADSYLIGLVGSGIGPSLSPPLHEREAAELGLAYRYTRWDLDELGSAPEEVGDLLAEARAAGYRGLNITHPCKQLVVEHLDELSPDAAALGSVNTVVFEPGRAIGHNTDWSGFSRSLTRGLPGAPLDRLVLLGAGGAGSAVGHALLSLGAAELTVVDVDADRSTALADGLRARFGDDRVTAGTELTAAVAAADGLVHATPTGMAEHPGLPLPAELLRPDLWVADVVYRPLRTELVEAAHERGCRVLPGGGMAVFQAADALELFTGVRPDVERMLRHFAELVDPVAGGAGARA
ncbi:shikimate dehydrogenase [Saccharopolyspora cebuensis]|uniref:Shikimate dehydrogenase (NADP(+)) n=1 Tax=Saccharopolyspora cebuensis TaxID=418759 RepID=A0ABV4CRC3_9PSEU